LPSASGRAAVCSTRLSVDGVTVLQDSHLGLKFKDGSELGRAVSLVSAVRGGSDTEWINPLGKRRNVRDHHLELKLTLRENSGRIFAVTIRVFDDGVAFKYVLPESASVRNFVLEDELTEFAFTTDNQVFAGDNVAVLPTRYDSPLGFAGSQEWEFRKQRLSDLSVDTVTGLPALIHTPAAWVAVTEANLYDWAGMWIFREPQASGTTAVTLRVRLAPRLDGDGLVKASLPHDSPWRVLMIGHEPGRLIESDIVLNLSAPSRLADSS